MLLDVERVAPCMPGARLLTHDGDQFTGEVKVKLGPINLTYGGKAEFVTLDEEAGVAVIDASGKETRGTGTAKATITCRLTGSGSETAVEVDTDLNVTGKPASFGRGVLADVSAKLVDQFAACLAEEIRRGTPANACDASDASDASDSSDATNSSDAIEASDAPGADPAPSVPGTLPLDSAVTGAGSGPAAQDQAADVPFGPPPTSGLDIALAETLAHPHGETGTAEPVPAGTPQSRGDEGAAAVGTATAIPTPGPATASSSATSSPATASNPATSSPAGASNPAASPDAGGDRAARPQAEAIDLLGTAGVPVLKRLAPVVAAVAALLLVLRRLRR